MLVREYQRITSVPSVQFRRVVAYHAPKLIHRIQHSPLLVRAVDRKFRAAGAGSGRTAAKIRPGSKIPLPKSAAGVIIEANTSNCQSASPQLVRPSEQAGVETKGEPSLNPSICYVVGAMPLSWSLCPHPGAQDFLIAADKGYEALEA